ncbi:helix-turn-helix domain-containing protein [Sphingobacterium sp. UDSM-2020]|uniref:helix-turn-helix domain-containing protein n=1 Tax=Sphingobacterium sp. UDSM-2020 TaxID=2795738 RepID=UPI0019372E0D|nr:helix-turn-helix domain-containing protein [Sphingobacterium sp. UDSM-2020]QQD14258.1 AraC family transcriptional regulator [Sphingobacterium sp. UDSM-2020]
MKRTITLNQPDGATEVMQPNQEITYPMHHAETYYWEHQGNQFVEQTFDGRYAYLYYFEFRISTATTVTCRSHAPDLHLCYPIETGEQPLMMYDELHDIKLILTQNRASYLYLSVTDFQVDLPIGHYIIRGITLDAGLFRPNFTRSFAFVMPLVHAKRNATSISMQSVDFLIGTLTKHELDAIFQNLNPKVLDNEHILIRHQIYLIKLSRLKIMMGDGSITTPLTIINHVREILSLMIDQYGNKALIGDLAESVQVDRSRIYKLHKEYYRCNLSTYRNELLVERILREYDHFHNNLSGLAYELNFAGLSELNRFFKKMKGQSLTQYQKH